MQTRRPFGSSVDDNGLHDAAVFRIELRSFSGVVALVDRKTRLEAFLVGAPDCIRYSDHQIDHGAAFYKLACQHGLEGIVSKRVDGRYEPDRRSWLKVKCLRTARSSWLSAGPIPKALDTGSARSFSAITRSTMGSSSTRAASAPACRLLSLSGCMAVSSRSRSRRCRYRSRHHVVVGSDRRSCSRGSIGCVLRWSSRSRTSRVPDGLLRHVVYLGEREDKAAIDVRHERSSLKS